MCFSSNKTFFLSDPMVSTLPLVKSPVPSIFIIAAYLTFVHKNGREFMKNREPFKLKSLIHFYNVVQILFNAFIFYEVRKCVFFSVSTKETEKEIFNLNFRIGTDCDVRKYLGIVGQR